MIKFEKYNGLGNDFIILKSEDLPKIDDMSKFVIKLCDRHFGIGADGLIIFEKKDGVPFMNFFNNDGSTSSMCGNGIRCFTHYLLNNNFIELKNDIEIKTGSGPKYINVLEKNNFKVNMGKPNFELFGKKMLKEKINVLAKEIEISYVFTGVDHAVVFVDDFNEEEIKKVGKEIENMLTIFPNRVNVNFVKIIDRKNIEVVTFERGAGLTLACGTGACASTVISNFFDLVENEVTVKLPGGNLAIEYVNDEIFMTGPSEKVFEGRTKTYEKI